MKKLNIENKLHTFNEVKQLLGVDKLLVSPVMVNAMDRVLDVLENGTDSQAFSVKKALDNGDIKPRGFRLTAEDLEYGSWVRVIRDNEDKVLEEKTKWYKAWLNDERIMVLMPKKVFKGIKKDKDKGGAWIWITASTEVSSSGEEYTKVFLSKPRGEQL